MPPLVVSSQTLDNRNSSVDQEMSFTFSKTVSVSSHWEHSSGFSFGKEVGRSISESSTVSASAGVSFFGFSASVGYEKTKERSASVSFSTERSSERSYGGELSHEETWEA